MRKWLAALMVATLMLAACGGDEGENGEEEGEGEGTELAACEDEIPAGVDVSDQAGIPADFPFPDDMVVTGAEEAGPSVIVEGVFLDPTGAPVPDAEVTLSVSDWAGAVDPGDEVSTIYALQTTTDRAGRFSFRGPPSPEVIAYVAGGEAVNFDLTGLVPGTGQGGFWSFPRGIDGSAWVGDAPTVELRVLAP